MTHNGGTMWIGGILYVDDFCLISTDAYKLQMMINTCQTWSEKARMQRNADTTKVTFFHHSSPQCMETSTESSGSQSLAIIIQHPLNLAMLSDYINHTDKPQRHPWSVSALLQEVTQCDYLGLRLDPMMTMKATMASFQEKKIKGHSIQRPSPYPQATLCLMINTTQTLPFAARH